MNIYNRFKGVGLLFLSLMLISGIVSSDLVAFDQCIAEGTFDDVLPIDAPQLCHTAESGRLRDIYVEAIGGAQESILIFTFSFSDIELIDLLNQRADEGLNVSVIINNDNKGTISKLNHGNIAILTRKYREGRVHHKILVVDGDAVWLGSANFTASGLSNQENLMTGVRSYELAQVLHDEADVFRGIRARDTILPPAVFVGEQEVEMCLLPHCDPYYDKIEKSINDHGKHRLLSLIVQAEKTIRIAMMVWTEQELAQAVIDAHRRGVQVEVLFNYTDGDIPENLKKAGVFVASNPNLNFMHNKFMIVDDTTLVNGSANWSKSSFSRNDESFFIISNLNEQQQGYLNEYWIDLMTR